MILCNFIQINDASIDRNILIIESKIRPILENGFSILPINKKFHGEYDKTINSWYKTIIGIRRTSSSTITRMIIKYHTTFQRNNARLLSHYHRIMSGKAQHKNIYLFKQDIALTYDNYDDDLEEEINPFTINYPQCKTHTSILVILLDKLGLSEYKYDNKITSLSKTQWKKLISSRLAKIQYNFDLHSLNESKNTLIKNKFKYWRDCENDYIKKSIFNKITQLSDKYNPFIWRLLTNDLQFNWKSKTSKGIEYKFEKCIFCDDEWHGNKSPMKHLFEECNTIHEIINIKINNDDTIDKIYGKWSLPVD